MKTTQKLFWSLGISLSMSFWSPTNAQEKPGDTSLASSDEELSALAALDQGDYRYTVEDYFGNPKAFTFRFSPDGKYLSYRESDANGKRHIYVKNMETNEIKMAIEEKEELVRVYGWLNNERLYFSMDKGGNENYHIYAVDLDGGNLKDLTPYDGVRAEFNELLRDDKEHIIVELNKNNPEVFEPYKLNVVTGEITQLYTNEDPSNPILGYDFDKNGKLKGFARLRDGVDQDVYYEDGEGGYKILKQLSWKDNFYIAEFNYATDYPHDAYVISNLDTDKSEIQLFDLKENKVIEKTFSHEQYDVENGSLSRTRNYEIDYIAYEGEKSVIVPISNVFKKMDATIKKELPGMQYSILDSTEDENLYMLYVDSDKVYGMYYAYNVDKDELTELYNTMPQLKPEDMAEMRPITFTSRDGITLHGYITLPKAALAGEKVPVIVNPHGGPQGVRDSWGFNPEAQLFASRGYATLQVNFRISGGYGRQFLESGFKEIGRKAMDDVEDGLKYVVEQGWVNPDKAAIYGGSHGGYAVLRGLTKTPDLYACGVDYVGVSNLFTFMKTIPPYWKPYLKIMKEIWYDEDDPAEKVIMEEVSPVYQIDKIKKPLFVVQGANDPRVNIDESDQIVSALRNKGYDVPYMVKYDEGHGFGKEENRLDLYRSMMGFYAKHLGQQEIPLPLKD
ncbi:S9 family peptidase [Flagellimonas zhangzhouensis]|uniref:Dipeptidyl aminopeptidase/acylaminoacyl peptidase n=1 Tax=Flagellimonas zhangzhouensis TaxID=1073328 RepID=A0A1H2Q409_9FLAO|nr:S9 family peptidase [Allomuricauda zhangzhouensis]SDQ47950.1 Dipeptidyl aminopeptidase/acylaminoacyl peptidase [Allomuricauda zhangzhouensis]SDW01897.1 Dipeptidyl aminopeptidase/acylaminoacyl peptidase [Allomuricauda zhangzhouensis]